MVFDALDLTPDSVIVQSCRLFLTRQEAFATNTARRMVVCRLSSCQQAFIRILVTNTKRMGNLMQSASLSGRRSWFDGVNLTFEMQNRGGTKVNEVAIIHTVS